MTPANPDALADALASEIAGILLDGGALSPNDFARRLVAGPLAPLLADLQRITAERDAEYHRANKAIIREAAAEARAAQLQAEVEAKDRALKDERARRKAATQSLREKAAALCDEAAAYFDRTTSHYDRTQAAGGYRATASKIRLLTPDRTALAARAATAREG